jgi:NADPH-dependent F420 reductase
MENSEAAKAADICVLTVVAKAHEAALESLKEAVQGKILVDATARVAFPDATAPEPPSAGRIAQDILGDGATVVMAFQNVPSAALKKNLGEKIDSHVLVCADDTKAAEEVIKLIEAVGMQGYYAGGLDNGFVVEGLTALLIHMNRHYGGHGTIQVAGIDKNKERD